MSPPRRSKFVDAIFGKCTEFPLNQLPTKADVIKHILYCQRSDPNKFVPIKSCIERSIQRLKYVWAKTGIKIIQDLPIYRYASRVFERLQKLQKNTRRPNFKQKSVEFKKEMEQSLFDISSCKCCDH